MIFKLYGEDLHNIQALYEKHKDQPPIPRNMTRIAGNIHWSRQLLRRITSPMKKFQENPRVFFPRDSKKIVRHYNKGQSLPAFAHNLRHGTARSHPSMSSMDRMLTRVLSPVCVCVFETSVRHLF